VGGLILELVGVIVVLGGRSSSDGVLSTRIGEDGRGVGGRVLVLIGVLLNFFFDRLGTLLKVWALGSGSFVLGTYIFGPV
jgi:hypothetical protein